MDFEKLWTTSSKEEGTVSIIFCPVLKRFFKISWENENATLICTRIAEN